MDNYYAVLGVAPSADLAVIKQAYYKQLKALHPDRNPHPSSHYLTTQLNLAFATLSQADLRLAYDQALSQAIGPLQVKSSWPTHLSIVSLWLVALALICWLVLQNSTPWPIL